MKRLPLRRVGCGAVSLTFLLAGCSSSPLEPTGSGERSPLVGGSQFGGSQSAVSFERARPAEVSDERLPKLDGTSGLADYQRYAALRNAGLAAGFHAWKASSERSAQTGALPDPRLTLGAYLGEVETRVGPTKSVVGVAQGFPWPGTLADRGEMADRAANAAWRRFEAARRTLALRVERIYNTMFLLQRSIEITGENIEILLQVERVARVRYRVDVASHPDLVRIQLELGAIEDRLRQFEARRESVVAEFNAALNRPTGAEVVWPSSVRDLVCETEPDLLRQRMLREHPDLLALQEEIERERLGTELAKKDGYPGFTVGLTWTAVGSRPGMDFPENGDDSLLATVTMSIPLWRDKVDAGVREALARRLGAASRHEDARQKMIAELEGALFEHRDAQRRVSLYRDTLLPKAQESLNVTLAAFAQGTSSFIDVLDVQRMLLEFQLAIERARREQATAYARLERLAGPLDIEAPVGVTEETMP